ncbi:hypothetical protein TRAPUB_11063 [Trametes pubescens]|uniref:Uncharacterized protein n=1 Tax=Trametes pubescens TaxID=154538 RepID=A0A1M2VXR0_TRAPU|nr:hypothetical protein TRAPUB_11063 [Trametes pubescens]
MSDRSIFTRLPVDVWDLLLDTLPLSVIQTLRKTCIGGNITVSTYLSRRCDTLLSEYFIKPAMLLRELSLTSSVFSGSFALWVLFRLSCEPGGIDIYTPLDYFPHVVSYLIAEEGYDSVRPLRPCLSGLDGVGAAVALQHSSGRVVKVMKSSSMCSLLPLASFSTTATMAYITADASFCIAYPVLSEQRRSVLNPLRLLEMQYPPPSVLDVIKKIERRGFEVREHEYSWRRETWRHNGCAGADTECCPLTVRWFGDSLCARGSLRTSLATPVHYQRVSYLNLLTALWWRGGMSCGGGCMGPDEGMSPGVFTMPRDLLL